MPDTIGCDHDPKGGPCDDCMAASHDPTYRELEAEVARLRRVLTRLYSAADTFAGSESEMPSFDDAAAEFDAAMDEAHGELEAIR